MGELSAAVSTLLGAFSSGIAIIKRLKRRRHEEGWPTTDSSVKREEIRLAKSLKKNRTDVQTAYTQDLTKFGSQFAKAKAQSSLASILLRLNVGFVSIIDRFIKGESTQSDYKLLVDLSNTSGAEAIDTFEQLSRRLPQPAIALPEKSHSRAPKKSSEQKTSSGRRSATGYPRHFRSKSAPELSLKKTILGPATAEGWVRPKVERKISSMSAKSNASLSSIEPRSPPKPKAHSRPDSQKSKVKSPTSQRARPRRPANLHTPAIPANRISIISFASDSTKLGEIPDRKWASIMNDDMKSYSNNTAFPLSPWEQREPKKPRSKFMRLFRK